MIRALTGPQWLDLDAVIAAMRHLLVDGEPVDWVTVCAELRLGTDRRSTLIRQHLIDTWRLWAPDQERS